MNHQHNYIKVIPKNFSLIYLLLLCIEGGGEKEGEDVREGGRGGVLW